MKSLKVYLVISILFTFIFGSLLHFTYNLSGKSEIVASFSAVNESTWEHLKLLFFPMLISTIIGYFVFRKSIPNFLCARTIGIIIAMAFTVIFFYTYTGILGKNIPIIDISSFFIATILGEILSYLFIINKLKCNNTISVIVLILLFIFFIIFTFYTPKIGIFKDPITGIYGIGS